MPGVLSSESSRLTVAVAAGIGFVTAAAAAAYWYRKKYLDNIVPIKWRKVGEVTDLIVYPIKSCGAIRVSEIGCSKLGLADGYLQDRVFMIVHGNGKIVSTRKHPNLVLIQPNVEKNSTRMKLSAPGMIDIEINFEKLYKKEPTKKYLVSGRSVDAIDCGDDVAKWISRFLLGEETGLWLVFNSFETMKPADIEASYMLFNDSSLLDLNTRLDNPALVLQFRPNIVVRGASAYDEDNWKWIKIGNDIIFRNVNPCTRCSFVNIHPETGLRSPDGNPLKTLRTYRKLPYAGERPVLGIYLDIRSEDGNISLGDTVYVNF